MVALVLDARARGGEVAAGVGLGKALAPDLVGAQDLREVALLLLGVPQEMIVGPAMPSPITPRCDGASARAISSRKIAWWLYGARRRRTPRPGQAGVAGRAEPAAPLTVVVLEAASSARCGALGQVLAR